MTAASSHRQGSSATKALSHSQFDLRLRDRFQTLLAVWFALIVVVGVPIAVAVGADVHESRTLFYAEQDQNRQQVTAIVTGEKAVRHELANPKLKSVPARWFTAGTEHTGLVDAPRGAKPGDAVDIWVDQHGYHVGLPYTTALDEAVAAGLATWLTVAAVTAVLLAGGWAVLPHNGIRTGMNYGVA
ncbi:hypothetical protein [Mycobacterium sp. 1423905.2]|uniref:Rv1733c family protein n=1 Tax=Mycobacterium sp. 1423905.2 TaxID=1856859 RepID=UPI0007FBF362|nr:hypothetical protein [Mycobacterium sp. 1423905.2]OBJ52574.1 hypothetical protein A9W95_01750 [Mycobacterium sp. 1423905.2]